MWVSVKFIFGVWVIIFLRSLSTCSITMKIPNFGCSILRFGVKMSMSSVMC